VLSAAEINSSFYRSHAPATYRRWAASTPEHFRFAVKVPKRITHEQGLRDADELFARFLDESDGLGDRRGPLLVQLPPSAAFDRVVASCFFAMVRRQYQGPVVCEPRHATWSTAPAIDLMLEHRVSGVAADPSRVPEAGEPSGWPRLVYFRWHGSPRVYWSSYDTGALARLAARVRDRVGDADVWCIFDNTASGAAIENAWELQSALFPAAPDP